MHVGSTSHVFQILKSVCKSLFLNDSVLLPLSTPLERMLIMEVTISQIFIQERPLYEHIVRRLVKEWMKRINGFLEMYTAKTDWMWASENSHYSEFPDRQKRDPLQEPRWVHQSSNSHTFQFLSLNHFAGLWIASAKKKKIKSVHLARQKKCV